MSLIASFTVKQTTGSDSHVAVYDDGQNWAGQQKVHFQTDQVLTSNSDRAWNVNEAIKNWARENGYELDRKPHKNGTFATYDPRRHSSQGEFTVRKAVQADPRYQGAKAQAEAERDEVNREYGILTRRLKNLVTHLENAQREQLDAIKADLIDIQVAIAQEIGIPEQVNDHDRKRILEPTYPYDKMEIDHYDTHGQGYDSLPDTEDFDRMLALLNRA